MFWADKIVEDFLEKRTDLPKSVIIRDEKTPSGQVHIGSMRGVAMHGIIFDILKSKDVEVLFKYEMNDFDAFDSVPEYLDESYKEHLGKPLYSVPSPEKGKNYAEYYAEEFQEVITDAGFTPQFYYLNEQYKAGKFDEAITLALHSPDIIRDIYKEVSGSTSLDNSLPLMVVCEKCGKIATTRVTSFDGKLVHYMCDKEGSGAVGCGYEGDISPYGGNAKLPWKVDWAAKFKVFGVGIEGEGKDHATRGGSRDVANEISRRVFSHEPPYDFWYEFFLVGGKKMSSSKGSGSSAKEVASLLSTKIFRLALLGKEPRRAINFEPDGETIPLLYDQYDRIAEKYFGEADDDESRLFELIHHGGVPSQRFLPRFSQVAFLVQMPHMDIEEEVARIKGSELTVEDKEELAERVEYAKTWLSTYAPERYVYELQLDTPPEATKDFSPLQKEALQKVLEYVNSASALDGQELHTTLHEIRKEMEIEPKDFFSAFYIAFLNKESGPKIGWFLSVLDKAFLTQRLEEVSA